MKAIIKVILGVCVFMAVSFLAYILMMTSIIMGGDIPHASDEELIANFQSHKAEFNQLLQMIVEDKELKRVDNNWTLPENPQTIGVTQERINEYRKLFRKLGVPRGFAAFQSKDNIEFIASSQGLAVGGSSKGYVYAKELPRNIVDDLDKYRVQTKKPPFAYPVYRHIDGNWYLYFEAN